MTRLPIINLQTYQLPSENVEQRGLMVAELQKPDGQTFYMANTHLTNSNLGAIGDANHDLRKQQVDTVNQVIDDITEQTGKTVILVGDMNASSSTPEYKNLISQSMSDTIDISDDVNSTVPATGKDYDHILWTGDEDSVVENGDMRGGDGASDHCSLTTVLKVGIDLDGGWLADEHADELDDSLAPRD